MLYTSEDMVGESINWINFSTDQKHAYAVKAYMDRDSNAYIGDDDSSYEYLYFNADGEANEIHFSVNEGGGITETDEEFLDPESALEEEEGEGEDDDGVDIAGEGGVSILLWLPYLIEYLDGLAKLTDATGFTASCGADEAPNFFTEDTMRRALIYLIRLYQLYLTAPFEGACIYTPSCSQYSIEAIDKYGAWIGTKLSMKRLLRCRPPYKGGHDPVA